jgi:hypothetical protein
MHLGLSHVCVTRSTFTLPLPSGIEAATFRLVAQCLNQLSHHDRVQVLKGKVCYIRSLPFTTLVMLWILFVNIIDYFMFLLFLYSNIMYFIRLVSKGRAFI